MAPSHTAPKGRHSSGVASSVSTPLGTTPTPTGTRQATGTNRASTSPVVQDRPADEPERRLDRVTRHADGPWGASSSISTLPPRRTTCRIGAAAHRVAADADVAVGQQRVPSAALARLPLEHGTAHRVRTRRPGQPTATATRPCPSPAPARAAPPSAGPRTAPSVGLVQCRSAVRPGDGAEHHRSIGSVIRSPVASSSQH